MSVLVYQHPTATKRSNKMATLTGPLMPARQEAPAATIHPRRDEGRRIKVVEWHGGFAGPWTGLGVALRLPAGQASPLPSCQSGCYCSSSGCGEPS